MPNVARLISQSRSHRHERRISPWRQLLSTKRNRRGLDRHFFERKTRILDTFLSALLSIFYPPFSALGSSALSSLPRALCPSVVCLKPAALRKIRRIYFWSDISECLGGDL